MTRTERAKKYHELSTIPAKKIREMGYVEFDRFQESIRREWLDIYHREGYGDMMTLAEFMSILPSTETNPHRALGMQTNGKSTISFSNQDKPIR